jgi:hypothetical protein
VNPPKFVLSVNNSKHFHFSYNRYLENRIREHFGFWGTPMEIELRSRESIYKNKERDLKKDEGKDIIKIDKETEKSKAAPKKTKYIKKAVMKRKRK